MNEGLLQSTVTDMEIDKNNFCWISFPNGIQKFDGHNFTNIPIQPGLPDDKNVYFFKSKSGVLLLGHSKGISKYDINKNSFELIYKHSTSNIYAPLFLGEDNGIIYFTLITGTIIELDSRTFKKIAETNIPFSGDLLILNGNLKLSSNIIDHRIVFLRENKLYLWDLQKRKMVDQSKTIPLMNAIFLKMKSGNEVNYYQNESDYLYTYNFTTGATSRKPSPGFQNKFISRTNSFQWHEKNLVSFDKNLYEIDIHNLELKTQLVNFQNQPIGGSAINIIKKDNFGNLWISTIFDGIKKVINSNYEIKYYGGAQSGKNFTMTIFPDKINNRVLIGSTKDGLLVFDTLQRFVKSISKIPRSHISLAVNQIVKNERGEYFLFIPGAKFIVKLSSDLKDIIMIAITPPPLPRVAIGVGYFANLLYQNSKLRYQ